MPHCLDTEESCEMRTAAANERYIPSHCPGGSETLAPQSTAAPDPRKPGKRQNKLPSSVK